MICPQMNTENRIPRFQKLSLLFTRKALLPNVEWQRYKVTAVGSAVMMMIMMMTTHMTQETMATQPATTINSERGSNKLATLLVQFRFKDGAKHFFFSRILLLCKSSQLWTHQKWTFVATPIVQLGFKKMIGWMPFKKTCKIYWNGFPKHYFAGSPFDSFAFYILVVVLTENAGEGNCFNSCQLHHACWNQFSLCCSFF